MANRNRFQSTHESKAPIMYKNLYPRLPSGDSEKFPPDNSLQLVSKCFNIMTARASISFELGVA